MAQLSSSVFLFVACLVFMMKFAVGEVVPFIEPGFFFSYGSIPVTEQCETVRLIWGRQGAIGQNPVAPYFFQVFTSSFVFPFVVDAGEGGDAGDGNLFFDFTVPFAPGTQYQICMYDSNGLPGGCQVIFTMIQNPTDNNPTCENMTMPAVDRVLDVQGIVDGGPMSQSGFINQCDDVSIKPLNGTPPFILTVSPPNHPPYNITSHTMAPIVWTVSLSRAMPFFLSLVSSEGMLWSNGPMGVGRSDDDSCLAPDSMLKSKAHAVAAGAGVGGIFGGLLIVGVALVFQRGRARRVKEKTPIIPWYNGVGSGLHSSIDTDQGLVNSGHEGLAHTYAKNGPNRSVVLSSFQYTNRILRASDVYIRHQDGGRLTSSRASAEPVELPPMYAAREEGPEMLAEKPEPRLQV
ncbi:hypothetical protein GGU10DRAFT_363702 [Lentinula aff. detonsa]|uniref:Uncharacterized protein n=1 Tax=Lentinula aff. detonsa TaxID=2804958 RepID=A0AA38L2U3_9AGAR|nr:hypothetical protein GGU10DRAFT_363702 [Lentinula aff. detonsa]